VRHASVLRVTRSMVKGRPPCPDAMGGGDATPPSKVTAVRRHKFR
jgi:hypothetical protein